jgi:voltage-gated potassium channel
MSASALLALRLRFSQPDASWRSVGAWLDLLCVLPLSSLGLSAGSDLLMIRHVWQIRPFLDEFPALQPVVYRLVPIALTLPLLVHGVACGWIALGSGTAGPDPDATTEYVRALYWAFTTLTTVGYGDISARTSAQMLLASGVQVLGVAVFGFVLSNVASLIARMDAAREHHMDSVERIENFMRSNRIPQALRSEVRTYYHYLWRHHRGYHDQSLLSELPAKIQADLSFFINRSIIEKVPLFRQAGPELVGDLMAELKPRIYAPGEKVFRSGDAGDSIYFVQSGQVEILGAGDEMIASLADGACFGEMALMSDRPRSATARARTYCNLYVLSKASFERVIRAYPDFRREIEQMAIKRRNAEAP